MALPNYRIIISPLGGQNNETAVGLQKRLHFVETTRYEHKQTSEMTYRRNRKYGIINYRDGTFYTKLCSRLSLFLVRKAYNNVLKLSTRAGPATLWSTDWLNFIWQRMWDEITWDVSGTCSFQLWTSIKFRKSIAYISGSSLCVAKTNYVGIITS